MKSLPPAALVAAVIGFALPAPASAAMTDCNTRETAYNWSQSSCLSWSPSSNALIGGGGASFRTGFNREGVKKCTMYLRLVSSYGTRHDRSYNCYSDAHRGGGFSFRNSWGPGRYVGDRYTQSVWLVVTTGAGTYDGYPWRAIRTVEKF